MSELPIDANFKSTLPPRKRAKTKEEKEQRRVERILRNRRAAHASREKKRKHVEYLESYVLKLEQNLANLQSNHDDAVNFLSAEQAEKLSPLELADLSDLKDKIHSNLNSSASSKKSRDDDDDDDYDLKDDDESDDLTNLSVASEGFTKVESVTDNNLIENNASSETTVATNTASSSSSSSPVEESVTNDRKRSFSDVTEKDIYYNYLSPISINSPINSPIDLTIKKGPSNSYDLLGQNSEVILRCLKYINTAPIIPEYMDFSKESSTISSPSNQSTVSSDSSVDDFLLDKSNSNNVGSMNGPFDDYSDIAGESTSSYSFILDLQHQLHQSQQPQHNLESDFGVNIEEFLSL